MHWWHITYHYLCMDNNDEYYKLFALHQIIAPTRKNTPNICLKHMGKFWSTVFMSVENREIMRPLGVVSKKSIGAPKIRCNILWWMTPAACIVPYAWHSAAIRNVTTVCIYGVTGKVTNLFFFCFASAICQFCDLNLLFEISMLWWGTICANRLYRSERTKRQPTNSPPIGMMMKSIITLSQFKNKKEFWLIAFNVGGKQWLNEFELVIEWKSVIVSLWHANCIPLKCMRDIKNN